MFATFLAFSRCYADMNLQEFAVHRGLYRDSKFHVFCPQDSASERQSPRILMAGREETGSLTPIG